MKKNPKLLWIIGFLMVAGGLYLVISTITPPGYKKTTGTILNSGTANPVPSYDREIRFTTEDGQTYTVRDRSYSNGPRVSDEVTVAYNAEDPAKTMRVTSDSGRSTLWGAVVLIIGAGLVYLGLGNHQPRNTYTDPTPDRTPKTKKKQR